MADSKKHKNKSWFRNCFPGCMKYKSFSPERLPPQPPSPLPQSPQQPPPLQQSLQTQSFLRQSQQRQSPQQPSPLPQSPPELQNKGEICYMNSIVQALGSCLKMKDDLKKLRNNYKSIKLQQFIKLLTALNSKNAQTEFDDFISSYGWKKEGQQDSFEMMTYFINLIYNELKVEEMELQKEKDKHEFEQIWKSLTLPCRINMNSRTKCGCQTDNKNILNDLALHLPLVNDGDENNINYDINEMIKAVLRVDPVDDNCDKCDENQTVVISLDGEPTRTLCFHIQANKFNWATEIMTKPEYELEYPFDIKVQNQDYKLVSFVEHLGGVSVGHYVAYRRFGEEWFSVNDNYIKKLKSAAKPTEYCKKPYVLFYEAV